MALQTCLKADHFNFICGHQGRDPFKQNFRPGKVVHLKRWTSFFETFLVGPNRSIEFRTEISGILVERIPPQVPRRSKKHALRTVQFANFVASHRTLGVLREKMASSSNQEEGKASRKHGFYLDDCFTDTLK